MMNRLVKFLAVALVAVLTGCATVNKMPVQSGLADISVSEKSILLAKVVIKNEKAPSHQPDLCCIFIDENGEAMSFTEPALVQDLGEGGKAYLVSLQASPGKVMLNTARFIRRIPLLMNAIAEVPFQQELNVPANSIVYLGNINAVVKDKLTGDEPSAGLAIPLIDQAVAGFSSGTFVVTVSDNYDADMAEFYKRFPYLQKKQVSKMVLPEWVHPDLRSKAVAQE